MQINGILSQSSICIALTFGDWAFFKQIGRNLCTDIDFSGRPTANKEWYRQ
jgi:hypothetical protein